MVIKLQISNETSIINSYLMANPHDFLKFYFCLVVMAIGNRSGTKETTVSTSAISPGVPLMDEGDDLLLHLLLICVVKASMQFDTKLRCCFADGLDAILLTSCQKEGGCEYQKSVFGIHLSTYRSVLSLVIIPPIH